MRTRVNKTVNRTDRLNPEFQREIYDIITRRLKNPLVTEMFSVLRVDCTKDLSHAKVYISVYSASEEKKNATFNAIKSDAKRFVTNFPAPCISAPCRNSISFWTILWNIPQKWINCFRKLLTATTKTAKRKKNKSVSIKSYIQTN